MVEDPRQRDFGQKKWTSLPRYCRECEVLSMCNGGCPKDRVIKAPDGEEGLNYLCAGLKQFFTHSKPYFRKFAELADAGEPTEKLMEIVRAADAKTFVRQAGRNDPCRAGAGKSTKGICWEATKRGLTLPEFKTFSFDCRLTCPEPANQKVKIPKGLSLVMHLHRKK
jgi:uncharacterized protein